MTQPRGLAPESLDRLLLDVHARLAGMQGLDAQLGELMRIVTERLEAERATLYLHDARTGELFSRIALGAGRHEIRLMEGEGVAGQVFVSGVGSLVPDAPADARFNPRIDAVTGFETRDMVCVPMRAPDGAIVGVAQALNHRGEGFDQVDLELLEALTAQAALVLRQGLLLEEMGRSGEQEARFVRLVSELSSEIQLGPLLQKIMAAVTRMLDADRSTLFLNDERTGELFTEIGQGLGAEKIRFANDRGIAGAVFSTGESINLPHAYADLRFNPSFDRQTGYFTRSILCVPVVNKTGKIIGVTQVLNKRGGGFTDEDEARLRAFTAQIAIGLENAKLFDDVQAMQRYNHSILASMSSGVVTFDDAGVAVTCNQAAERILRRSGGELIGQSAESLFGPGAWVLDKLARALESGEAESAVDALLELDEVAISVNLTAMPLAGAQGEAMGSMLLLDDISREKRIKSTMARYVDAKVADRLLEADAEILGGQSSVATVLFCDIRGFTPLSEALGPQATVALLNDYFTRMVGCIEAEGGMLDKFVGDLIMAVFGVPYAHEDDADRALRAAVGMQRELRAMNAARVASGEARLDVGIGIHTGEVFSGNVGSPRRMDFTVMGDGVNLASRLESACKQYRAPVLYSEAARLAARGTYRSREIDRMVVKGKTEPVLVHELLEHHDAQSFPGLIDSLAHFRDGLALYRDSRWSDAIAAFERCLAIHPADGVAELYVARCQRLASDPPAAGWDGVWVLTEK